MDQATTERLRDFLAQLAPQAQALLIREFERALERRENAAVAQLVLGLLHQIVRGAEPPPAQLSDPVAALFAPVAPFLIDHSLALRPGEIRRTSLAPVWQWLGRDGAPARVRDLEAAAQISAAALDRAAHAAQDAVAEAIAQLCAATGPESQRALARVGAPPVIEDLKAIGAVLKQAEALAAYNQRLPRRFSSFGPSQVQSVIGSLKGSPLQSPTLLPFALSTVMQRLPEPWQIIRVAVAMAASDDELRVAASPFGVAVTMAIAEVARLVSELRNAIKRGHFEGVGDLLKAVHDGIRGLRTELDLRNDSAWGKQMASIRVDISDALQSEIESVPGRVRRLIRQRAEKDITPTMTIDESEVEEVAALIGFVAACRTHASELAINEVTLRTYSELQQYVEKSTEALVQSLRGGDGRVRAYRHQQARAAIRFCEVLFGQDYAALMSRAAENAMVAPARKASSGG